MADADVPVGGYLQLELPAAGEELHPDAVRFQSCRAALRAVVDARRPARVWLPRFNCAEVAAALQGAGAELAWYDAGPELVMPEPLPLAADDLLVVVDYFGLSASRVDRVLAHHDPERVVVDHAQALYEPPRRCLATLYSPRKFVGLPDGGYVVTDLELRPLPADEEASVRRCRHLLQRLGGDVEGGYAAFKAADASLATTAPLGMSTLTRRLLASVDHERVRRARRANFEALDRVLGPGNRFDWSLGPGTVPLTYPLWRADAPALRRALIARKVFVPTYWPDLPPTTGDGDHSARLAREVLHLPVDQRYSPELLLSALARVEGLVAPEAGAGLHEEP